MRISKLQALSRSDRYRWHCGPFAFLLVVEPEGGRWSAFSTQSGQPTAQAATLGELMDTLEMFVH